MGERKGKFQTILSAKGAAGAGTAMDVTDFDEVMLYVSAPTSTLTVKFRGTIAAADLTAANWAAAGSVTNEVDGVAIVPIESATSVVKGDTGIALAGVAHAKLYRVNTSLLRFFNAIVTAWTSGAVTVKAYGIRKTR